MHALIEFIAGVVAFLAATALAQFGVDVAKPQQDAEVRRVVDCEDQSPSKAALLIAASQQDC